MKIKISKNKLIATFFIIAILLFTFWWGAGTPTDNGFAKKNVETPKTVDKVIDETLLTDNTENIKVKADPKNEIIVKKEEKIDSKNETLPKEETKKSEEKDKYLTDIIPVGKPKPIEPETVSIGEKSYTATMSVRCDTILTNIDWLDKDKVELVPSDGIIYKSQTVVFYEGESVFNVLQREMKKNKIHMEFVNTPIYNSAYIEGINNLYEFDCGELSGWMYRVNDWFPNYGCSRYKLQDGDIIEWLYTCDLGRDIGGYVEETK